MAQQLAPEIIKDIADYLDMGMLCFYNTKTGELEYYPDESINPIYDEEPWQDTMDKVSENYADYIRFEAMDSRESFAIMEDFVYEIPQRKIQMKFEDALARKKPFQQFKNLLSYYDDLLAQWVTYKLERYIQYVKRQLEYNSKDSED